jgi:hypothetical protein
VDWVQVLENIQAALALALAEIAERERTLEEGFSSSESTVEPEAAGQVRLEPLDQGVRRFQSCYQEAECQAAEVETQLLATQESIQQWLTAAAALRQRLARTTASSI